jgi:hypothetical protein
MKRKCLTLLHVERRRLQALDGAAVAARAAMHALGQLCSAQGGAAPDSALLLRMVAAAPAGDSAAVAALERIEHALVRSEAAAKVPPSPCRSPCT